MSSKSLMQMLAPSNARSAPGAPPDVEEVAAFKAAVLERLTYSVAKDRSRASERDWFLATAFAIRDRIVDRWLVSIRKNYEDGRKRVYYLSLEFLIGRMMFDALSNLGMVETARAALLDVGVDLDRLRAVEPDAALGNGGLGRLAACFMESMATLDMAAIGYGIRYDYGLFRQVVTDGWQHEVPEDWLSFGNPWEFERPELTYPVGFGGSVEAVQQIDGAIGHVWRPAETVIAAAFDTPIVGWRGEHVNTLRLWSARSPDPLRLEAFNHGDHIGALADRARVEAISRLLYPSDETPAGQELRLRQEYFFASASLQDLIRRHIMRFGDLSTLADCAAIQLNDTHPAISVAELMRLLVDEHGFDWDEAWTITRGALSYTNHTLLPEALESWPAGLMERLLPRHMQIIYLINARHLDDAREKGRDGNFLASVSLIDEDHGRRVRMGHLAFVGSRRINGVSALHTDLMKQTVFRDLHALYPERIVNKTNGVTFRRWLFQANPGLTKLYVEALGPGVLDDPTQLGRLVELAGDAAFQEQFARERFARKTALARLIHERMDARVDPHAMFDVQIKRMHEYKRQLLNVMETIGLYNAIRAQPTRDFAPRVKIFSGKAAASYAQAKLIIKLANDVARVVNSDPTVRGLLKVVFLENYNVSLAEAIIPAADLSEQISTAGMEASGTGNMKLALNGALTIGTLDGANVEIREHVGPDNIFIFGMTADEVAARRAQGIDAREIIGASPRLKGVVDAIAGGVFSPGQPERFRPIADAIAYHDHFMVCADFDAYWAAQREVDALWRHRGEWRRKSIVNSANMGWFSSDRTIREYARDIWGARTRADLDDDA